jgi:hypothetical protein
MGRIEGWLRIRRGTDMSWRARGIVIVGVVLVVMAALAILPSFVQMRSDWSPSAFFYLKELHTALMVYEKNMGVLPSDPRGSGYALYLLKDIVEGHASLFGDPFAEASGIPAPRFDDERRMLVGSHFAYLNAPEPATDDMVVLAEMPGLNPKRRYYLTLNGAFGWIEAQTDPLANRPLLGLRLVDGKFVPTRGDAATSAESSTR